MENNILETNFNFFEHPILYPITKCAFYESEKSCIFKDLDKILSIHEKSCKVVKIYTEILTLLFSLDFWVCVYCSTPFKLMCSSSSIGIKRYFWPSIV